MNKRELILVIVLILFAIGMFFLGFITGIPKSEALLRWEFDVPLGLMLLILFLFGKKSKNDTDDE